MLRIIVTMHKYSIKTIDQVGAKLGSETNSATIIRLSILNLGDSLFILYNFVKGPAFKFIESGTKAPFSSTMITLSMPNISDSWSKNISGIEWRLK